ncbi:Neurexophilin [Mactra antiquata]
MELPDPIKSKVWIEGNFSVKIGDTVIIRIQLYNGRNERRTRGGDLVRVWLAEDRLGAKTTAQVTDNKDGSYNAIIRTFWVGRPQIQAAIISPREVVATAFKRRYKCPPVLMNTAIFQHPSDVNILEETPCNYDNQIPGYKKVCNFTQENYNRPWYCGKPRHGRLLCQDWTMVADINLWNNGHDKQLLSNMEQELMSLKYTARKIMTNITLTVTEDSKEETVLTPKSKCNHRNKSVTWDVTSPTGYFYNNKWTNRQCSYSDLDLKSCLKNTTVILIGDSTTRQMFECIEQLIPCEWLTDTWSQSGKHRPAICANKSMDFNLIWKLHSLPFCTRNTPRHYFKSLSSYLNELSDSKRYIVVIHFYAHFLNYHSHVFYETLMDLKKGINDILARNYQVSIVIKGPHAYSFSKSPDHVIWMPDMYSKVYEKLILDVMKDLRHRIYYLESMDMTVCTGQWHIHAEQYVINSMVENMFSFVCSK